MIDKIPSQLKSRKFWLAVSAFIAFIATKQYNEALGVVTAYIGLEGAADVVGRYQDGKVEQQKLEFDVSDDDEPNVDTVVSGDDM